MNAWMSGDKFMVSFNISEMEMLKNGELTGENLRGSLLYEFELAMNMKNNAMEKLNNLGEDTKNELKKLMVDKGKLPAIKKLRELTNCGLIDARDFVEQL